MTDISANATLRSQRRLPSLRSTSFDCSRGPRPRISMRSFIWATHPEDVSLARCTFEFFTSQVRRCDSVPSIPSFHLPVGYYWRDSRTRIVWIKSRIGIYQSAIL